jgi:3',5'-cyclic AMP phosphodiesterase CpdA
VTAVTRRTPRAALGTTLLLLALACAPADGPLQGSDTSDAPDAAASGTSSPAPRAEAEPQAAPVRVVAVGDIACPPGAPVTATTCRQAATAKLARSLDPDLVIGLGDLQYDEGRLKAFRTSYDASWGGDLKERTFALPGNHEHRVPGAADFLEYFGLSRTDRRSVEVGGWRIYGLDSTCGAADCPAQARWLRRRLERDASRCSLLAMHHPRWSSGRGHGSDPVVQPFWRVGFRKRADIALAGHDHDYERFAPLDHRGHRRPDRGITSFVSGAGGKSLYQRGEKAPGSRVFLARRPGVLLLLLEPGEYRWRYLTVDGVVRDSGRRACVA